MKNLILPILALLIAAPSFAAETVVSLDIVKYERKVTKIKDKCFYSSFLGGVYTNRPYSIRDKASTLEGTSEVITGYDKDGLKRITVSTRIKCTDDTSEAKLYSQSGEAFPQELVYEDMKELLQKASPRCPLNIYVSGNGKFKKAAFDCKVFSEDGSLQSEPRMESGEMLNAPAT